jgi:hypothetical protein
VGASEGCNTAVLRIYQEEVCGGGDWYWRALTITLVAQIRSTSNDVLEKASLYFIKLGVARTALAYRTTAVTSPAQFQHFVSKRACLLRPLHYYVYMKYQCACK